jgi:hypothetical protein
MTTSEQAKFARAHESASAVESGGGAGTSEFFVSPVSYYFYLYQSAERQPGYRYAGARRRVGGEIFAVDLVENFEISDVGQKNHGFYDIRRKESLRLQKRLYIFEGLFCLRGDTFARERPRRGIDSELAGTVQKLARPRRVAVRANRRRKFTG